MSAPHPWNRRWPARSANNWPGAVLSILATVAKQERVRLSEHTVAGLEHARKQGRIGGRPRVVTDRTRVAELRAAGKSLGEIAAEMGLAKTTVAGIAREAVA
jgi:DNA invertase Pin-like site-specific DNA recombinase